MKIQHAGLGREPVFLAGPTASGKSAVALHLAQQAPCEIISVDSMQVYQGLDVGTAKPARAERLQTPHHGVDVCSLKERFDAARFVALAKEIVPQIQARERVPLFCGGTGLYFKAYLEGLGEGPAADGALRMKLSTTPLEELLAELALVDPETYQRIDRQNPRRVIRAIEVFRLTGKPFSRQRAEWAKRAEQPRFFLIHRTRSDIAKRISERVDQMFRDGLIAETEAALDAGLRENEVARQALGYRQVIEYVDGKRSYPETVELVKIRTRQFAKRQATWFRHQMQGRWMPVGAEEPAEETAQRIIQLLKKTDLPCSEIEH